MYGKLQLILFYIIFFHQMIYFFIIFIRPFKLYISIPYYNTILNSVCRSSIYLFIFLIISFYSPLILLFVFLLFTFYFPFRFHIFSLSHSSSFFCNNLSISQFLLGIWFSQSPRVWVRFFSWSDGNRKC